MPCAPDRFIVNAFPFLLHEKPSGRRGGVVL